jgi:predicted Zn-dependent peptidase
MGTGSPLYSRLYSQGLITPDFVFGVESVCNVAYAIFGGESRDPDKVLDEIKKAAKNGIDRALFNRVKKAKYGEFLRGLNSVDNVCYNYAESYFYGYDFLNVFPVIESITAEDAEKFLTDVLYPEHIAISVIQPV